MSSRRRPASAPGWGDRAFPRRSPAPRFKGRFEPLASSPALTIHDVERQTYDLLMTCSDLFMKQAEHALQTEQAAAIDRAAAATAPLYLVTSRFIRKSTNSSTVTVPSLLASSLAKMPAKVSSEMWKGQAAEKEL